MNEAPDFWMTADSKLQTASTVYSKLQTNYLMPADSKQQTDFLSGAASLQTDFSKTADSKLQTASTGTPSCSGTASAASTTTTSPKSMALSERP